MQDSKNVRQVIEDAKIEARYEAVELLVNAAQEAEQRNGSGPENDEIVKMMTAAIKLGPALKTVDRAGIRVLSVAELLKAVAFRMSHGDVTSVDAQKLSSALEEIGSLINDRGCEIVTALEDL